MGFQLDRIDRVLSRIEACLGQLPPAEDANGQLELPEPRFLGKSYLFVNGLVITVRSPEQIKGGWSHDATSKPVVLYRENI
jgi:hypothetical protein